MKLSVDTSLLKVKGGKMKRCLSAEDVKVKTKNFSRPKYKGRQSLQKFPVTRKQKTRQWSPKQKMSFHEYEDDYPQQATCLTVLPTSKGNSCESNCGSPIDQPDSPFPSLPAIEKRIPEWENLRAKLENVARDSEKDTLAIPSKTTGGYVTIADQTYKFGDTLWLYLQAYFANRQMESHYIQRSITTQSTVILRLRAEKRKVLKEIREFKLELKVEDDADINWLHAVYHPVVIENIQLAAGQVNDLLRKFEEFRELFPTFRAMIETEKEYTVEVNTRIGLLYMWHNTLNDLFSKIKSIREYFDFITGYRKRSSFSLGYGSMASPQSPQQHITNIVWPRTSENNELTASFLEHSDAPIINGSSDPEVSSDSISQMYADVVGRSLRLRGMSVVLDKIKAITERTLAKTLLTLQTPKLYAQAAASNNEIGVFKDYTAQEKKELTELTVHHKLFKEMNLPSFHHQFAFITRIPVDLVHHWLKMRSEKVSCAHWDLLTLNTLIEDSDDCLSAAIGVKNKYMNYVWKTTSNAIEQQNYLENFDSKLDIVFQNYLSYIRHWAQAATHNNDVELEWCERVITTMRSEWERVKVHSASVSRGEASAAQLFCRVGKDLLNRIVLSYLDEKMFSAGKELEYDFQEFEGEAGIASDGMMDDEEEDESFYSSVFVFCRDIREMIRHLRERALKCINFIKILSCDLEICSKYGINDDTLGDDLITTLVNTGHIMVKFANYPDAPFQVFCTLDVVNKPEYIDTLLNTTCSKIETMTAENNEETNYLVLIPTEKISKKLLQQMNSRCASMSLSLKTKTTLQLYINAHDDIYLISEKRKFLEECRRRFEKAAKDYFENERLTLKDEYCSCNEQIAILVSELKEVALKASSEIWNCPKNLEELILMKNEDPSGKRSGKTLADLSEKEASTLKATLKQAFNAAFEFDRELTRIVSLPRHTEFAERSVENACAWADFVIESVNAGHRITSRWAAIPLACLQFLTTDKVVAYLKPESFEKLMKKLNECLDCIRSPTIKESRSDTSFRKISENNSDKYSPLIASPLSPKKITVHERIQESVGFLEEDRQNYLEETRKVGRVKETKDGTSEHHFLRSKRAPFEWQRLENKILGAGSFGTCYLVMNLSNNCLMAMKQIKVSRDQTDNMKALVDEVEIFRQLDHPNLVRYYGIEVHKEELLIFMEYCSEGTLAKVCREGLELSCVRRYTHFLLQAVDYLHRKQIVHRDIKPANVFLTQRDILKLGDFGCSFRIRDPTTRMGEIVTYVGTTNYQAPELQTNTLSIAEIASGGTKASGYGRAVDVWAVGCVVLEMLTGKRPYYHLTHELQVVYQLGSGIPPPFTPEITNDSMIYGFLKRCFQVDPKMRATTCELLQDTFANIDATVWDLGQQKLAAMQRCDVAPSKVPIQFTTDGSHYTPK